MMNILAILLPLSRAARLGRKLLCCSDCRRRFAKRERERESADFQRSMLMPCPPSLDGHSGSSRPLPHGFLERFCGLDSKYMVLWRSF